jgi:lipoyl(octanoyl) transferase
VPCGVREQRYGVTSLVDLGLPVTMDDLDAALKAEFDRLFGVSDRIDGHVPSASTAEQPGRVA